MKKFLTAFAIAFAAVTGVQAQTWPSKPVTLVVPFPPGGSTDSIARAIGPKLSAAFGQQFVVDNKSVRPGPSVRSRQARSTRRLHVPRDVAWPAGDRAALIKPMQYDALKDFDLITVAVQAPNVLAVPAASPHKSLADVIAYLKANPGKMSFASAGNGSGDHLTAELFWLQTGTTGLPFKGGAPAISICSAARSTGRS